MFCNDKYVERFGAGHPTLVQQQADDWQHVACSDRPAARRPTTAWTSAGRLRLPFETFEVQGIFDREQGLLWIEENQLARRHALDNWCAGIALGVPDRRTAFAGRARRSGEASSTAQGLGAYRSGAALR